VLTAVAFVACVGLLATSYRLAAYSANPGLGTGTGTGTGDGSGSGSGLYASRAAQLHPHRDQFDFARSPSRAPHGGASHVQTSGRNQEKYPPKKHYRPIS